MLRRVVSQATKGLAKRSFSSVTVANKAPLASHKKYHSPQVAFTHRNFHNNIAQWQKTFSITELTTERYHRLSDELLEHICGKLEELADTTEMKGFDVEYNQGVMTISVGNHGTYVINKQPPNHQIWLSSPVSGPQRYDFDENHHTWFYHRDNHTLDEVLNTELSEAFGHKIDLLEGFEPEEK